MLGEYQVCNKYADAENSNATDPKVDVLAICLVRTDVTGCEQARHENNEGVPQSVQYVFAEQKIGEAFLVDANFVEFWIFEEELHVFAFLVLVKLCLVLGFHVILSILFHESVLIFLVFVVAGGVPYNR